MTNLNNLSIACFGGKRGHVGQSFVQGLTSTTTMGFPSLEQEFCLKLELKDFILLGRPTDLSVDRFETCELDKVGVIALAIKPGDVYSVTQELCGKLNSNQIVVSFAALIPLTQLKQWLNHDQVVRVMPTLGMACRAGDTALYFGDDVSRAQQQLLLRLCGSLGVVSVVKSDDEVDNHTVSAGCLVGFIADVLHNMVTALCKAGYTYEDALARVLTNTRGVTELICQLTYKDFGALASAVTTPNGITEQMRNVLARENLVKILSMGVEAGKNAIQQKRQAMKL